MIQTLAMSTFWQDTPVAEAPSLSQAAVDLVFKTKGRQLPADHAWTLSQAVTRMLPWLKDEPTAGIHLIHGAQSGNGWQQPDDTGVICLLYTSPSPRDRTRSRMPSSA